jgi:hypothetical protein
MSIFQPLTSSVSPMQPISPTGSATASAVGGLLSLFDTGGRSQGRAPTEDELFGARWEEFREMKGIPSGVTPGTATMQQLRDFGRTFPELEDTAFQRAKTAVNVEVAGVENDITLEQQIKNDVEKSWQTSPEGQYAVARASSIEDPSERAMYLEKSRAEFITVNAENEVLKKKVEQQGFTKQIASEAYQLNINPLKDQVSLFAIGISEVALAIQTDPSASFDLAETGILQVLPELQTMPVVNRNNIEAVLGVTRSALERKFKSEVSLRSGIPENELGAASEEWNKAVFASFDLASGWIIKGVDPNEIKKRGESSATIDMLNAGVPVGLMTAIQGLTSGSPELQTQLLSSLAGTTGQYLDSIETKTPEEARAILRQASAKDLVDARYAFTELVSIMTGQSNLGKAYPEVEQEFKDEQVVNDLIGAFEAHNELSRVEGDTVWNKEQWRRTLEVPAQNIVRRTAGSPELQKPFVDFISSDVMMVLGNLRDAATANGVQLSFDKTGKLVYTGTIPEDKDFAERFGFMPPGVAGATPPESNWKEKAVALAVSNFEKDNKKYIDDINYKLSVTDQLGDIGKSVRGILGAEMGPEATAEPAVVVGNYKVPAEVAADTGFVNKVKSVSSNLGIDSNDLLRIIEFETAGSWSPSIKAPTSTATGLIQFLESTAKGLGTTTAELAGMTREQQMDYVEKYLLPFKGRLKNFGDIYMAVHWPAGVGKDETYVMYKSGSKEYTANKNLDSNGDGTVTRGETLARVFSATGKSGRGVASTPVTAATQEFATSAAASLAEGRPEEVLPGAFLGGGGGAAVDTTGGAASVAPAGTVDATMPEAVEREVPTGADGQPTGEAPIVPQDQDIKAFLDSVSEKPDQTFASEEDFRAAMDKGMIAPGETVVVAGTIYLIGKEGNPIKLGNVSS